MAVTFSAMHELMQHQHEQQVSVRVVFAKNLICHTKQRFVVGIAVEQKASCILHPVKGVTDRNHIGTDTDRVHPCKVLIVIFIAGEGLFIGNRIQVGCRDGSTRNNPGCVLIKTALQLFRKRGGSIGTMIFTEFQAAPASNLFDLLYADTLVWFRDRNMACRLWFRKVK